MRPISDDDYLAELNSRLEVHPDFEPGMQFVRLPGGERGLIAGRYSWLPDPGVVHPFGAVAKAVAVDFVPGSP